MKSLSSLIDLELLSKLKRRFTKVSDIVNLKMTAKF